MWIFFIQWIRMQVQDPDPVWSRIICFHSIFRGTLFTWWFFFFFTSSPNSLKIELQIPSSKPQILLISSLWNVCNCFPWFKKVYRFSWHPYRKDNLLWLFNFKFSCPLSRGGGLKALEDCPLKNSFFCSCPYVSWSKRNLYIEVSSETNKGTYTFCIYLV